MSRIKRAKHARAIRAGILAARSAMDAAMRGEDFTPYLYSPVNSVWAMNLHHRAFMRELAKL